jgi:hypothetical protein
LKRGHPWDVVAFSAGSLPLFLALMASLFELHYGGLTIFLGSAGKLFWLISLLCIAVFAVSALLGWRQSPDRRMILGGGFLLTLCASPSVLLLAACFSGNCI